MVAKGSYSPRKKFNERHHGGLSRDLYDNRHRGVLTDIVNRSHEYYYVTFSPTKTINEQLKLKASDVSVLTESVDTWEIEGHFTESSVMEHTGIT